MLALRKKKEEAERKAAEAAAAGTDTAAAAAGAPSAEGGAGADPAPDAKRTIGIFGPAPTGRKGVTSADLRLTKGAHACVWVAVRARCGARGPAPPRRHP